MTEKEFRIMDVAFRTRASQLCRAKYQEVKTLLSKFLHYIESNEVLNSYIQSCDPRMSDEVIREMTNQVMAGWGEVTFDFGDDAQEEIGRQYRVLKYVDECENASRILGIGRAYDHDTRFQASVDGFLHGVVVPFVDNLNLYIHSIAMNVCASSEKNITINSSGNNMQINIAQDNATLNATQEIKLADWSSVEDTLRKINVAESDIKELKSILETERPASKEDLGANIKGWIAKIIVKVADGVVNLPFETAAAILSTIVCKYCGLA